MQLSSYCSNTNISDLHSQPALPSPDSDEREVIFSLEDPLPITAESELSISYLAPKNLVFQGGLTPILH